MSKLPFELRFTRQPAGSKDRLAILFDRKGRLSGAALRANQQELLGSLLTRDIKAEVGVPISLLSDVGKDFAQIGEAALSRAQDKNKATNLFGNSTVSEADAIKQITAPMKRIELAYYAYYKATLEAMRQALANPDIPASEESYTLNKNIVLPLIWAGLRATDSVRVSGRWDGLSAYTMAEKKKLRARPLFWKHTSKASRAFNAAVHQRLASIKPSAFVVQVTPKPTIVEGSRRKTGAGKYVAKATYHFQMGVPSWNPKFDALFTIPFTTGLSASTLSYTGLELYQKVGFSDDEIAGPRIKFIRRELHGIDRILAAEATRPWLRDIAAEAGRHLRSAVSGEPLGNLSKSALAKGQESAHRKAENIKNKQTRRASARAPGRAAAPHFSPEFEQALKGLNKLSMTRAADLQEKIQHAIVRYEKKGKTDTERFQKLKEAQKALNKRLSSQQAERDKEVLRLSRAIFGARYRSR